MIFTEFKLIPDEYFIDEHERQTIEWLMSVSIPNVHAIIYVLYIDNRLVPISIKGRGNDSWIHSLKAQYVDEMRAELLRMTNNLVIERLGKALLSRLEYLMNGLDETITVLPSMMPTTLYDTVYDVPRITKRLTELFPNKAVLFRTLNFMHNSDWITTLLSSGYVPLISRVVYLYHPSEKHSKNERKDQKKDIKRLEKSGYEVVHKLKFDEFHRMKTLYDAIYIEKYSTFNPHYTETFFEELYKTRPIDWTFIYDSDVLIAFMGIVEEGSVLMPAYFGMEERQGLYMMISSAVYTLANGRELRINNSAGAADYKIARGSKSHFEYHFIYTKHLSPLKQIHYKILTHVLTPVGQLALKATQFK